MSWMSQFFNPAGGYNAASDTSNQYYQNAQGYQQPYMQRGNQVGGGLQDMFGKLQDPAAMQNEWAQGYQTSPYAQQMMNQAQSSGMDAASAMGLGGSSAALGNIQSGASNIMQGDRQNYMNDLMQKYMAGIGLGENMYGVGANAANSSSQNAMNQGQDQAMLNYGKNTAGGEMFGAGLKGLGNLGTQWATGGFGQGGWGRGALQPTY